MPTSKTRTPPAAPAQDPPGPGAPPAAFPPYGWMNARFKSGIKEHPVPLGYAAPAGVPLEQAWHEKYHILLIRMANTLWPRWDTGAPGGPRWDGDATARMSALTDADFRLLPALMKQVTQPVVQQATKAAALASAAPHTDFFRREDGANEPWPVNEYLTADLRDLLAKAAAKAGLAPFHQRVASLKLTHCTAPTLPMKDAIQRPRPYQIASLRGLPFEYLYGPGAVTSALPSGHAIQGVMGVCGALMEIWDGLDRRPDLLEVLAQYAVDVGDRRVMAGVHYPSDNLASWCLALSLCDQLYGPQAADGRAFLVRAVRRHSVVYRALRRSRDPAYAPGLQWLDELARPGSTSR